MDQVEGYTGQRDRSPVVGSSEKDTHNLQHSFYYTDWRENTCFASKCCLTVQGAHETLATGGTSQDLGLSEP